MNNIFYDIPSNWYGNFANSCNAFKAVDNNSLVSPEIALDRGNLFNSLYRPYKNYQYRPLRPTNKLEELLYNVLKYQVTLIEISLYLDTHPQDKRIIDLYNQLLIEQQNAICEYEQNFGPITLDSKYLKKDYWNWLEGRWPWEGTK